MVERLLKETGIALNFSRLVVLVGHGSSSLNNPHGSAYDCGACAGAPGGPNARAFALMANDPRVKELLKGRSLELPQQTVFVGACHDTCNDSVVYYDLNLLPPSHQQDFERARQSIEETRERNAHERCRRFESAPLTLRSQAALRHVEGRSEDLSQVRPEAGHATNSICIVGDRAWSRGLFLDRRAFLCSYDHRCDDEMQTVLSRILQAVIPVCAGINLEYYFSFVDPIGYGCSTKLPHNIVSLLGVMNGTSGDLIPGLPWQMVEIHEPVRLLLLVETSPEVLQRVVEQHESLYRLCHGEWIQLATIDPETSRIHLLRDGSFESFKSQVTSLPTAKSSADWYRGWRDHLGFASIRKE